METQRSHFLNWPYYYQGKSMEDLKNALICTSLELETTRLAAQEEIRKREEQLSHLQVLLNKTISERDEAQQSYKALLLENFLFQQHQQPQQQPQPPPQQQQQLVHSGSSSSGIEDEHTSTKKLNDCNTNNNVGNHSSSDGEESIISSPPSPPPLPPSALPEYAKKLISPKKPLPEKGKLLQAVIKAGPLLQTLLLAGPLPQWRHPPPPLENFDIPPVTIPAANTLVNQPDIITANHHHQEEVLINTTNNNGYDNCGVVNRKRGFSYGVCDESSYEASKYQRVLLY